MALIYSSGGVMLVICGWVLLLTLFVVLELTRGLSRGALRAIRLEAGLLQLVWWLGGRWLDRF